MDSYLQVLSKLNKTSLSDPEQYFVASNGIIENEIPAVTTLIQSENCSNLWKFTVYMCHILTDIQRLLDPNASTDFDNLATAIQICAKFGLEPYLHPAMAKNKCFPTVHQTTDVRSIEECYERLNFGIDTFSRMLLMEELRNYQQFDDVLLTFLAAVFSSTRNDTDLVHEKLDRIYEISDTKYFHCLLVLKSNQALPVSLQKMLHRQLMNRLVRPNGFEVLCKCLIKTGDDIHEPMWKLSSTVFDIVGRKGHTSEFYIAIVDGIFQFLKKCIRSMEHEKYVDACVGSLSRIFGLRMEEISNKIVSSLVDRFQWLCTPKEIFAGYIVLDGHELTEVLLLNFACFCRSVHVVLPSEILVPYLRVLFQLFSQMDGTDPGIKIRSLIVQCLRNRDRVDLKSIINALLFEDVNDDHQLKSIHPRLVIQLNSTNHELKCLISKASDLNFFDASECLIKILKSSGDNILTYNIFIHVFEQLDGGVNVESTQSQPDLIQDEDELTQLMSQVFKKRVAVYYTLSELINHKQLHYQINENPSEMLSHCMNIIRNHLTHQPNNRTLHDDHSTILVLSIINEFLQKIPFTQQFDELVTILVELKASSKHAPEIVNQIDSILVALNHSQPKPFRLCDKSPFVVAKELCEECEPHLKVYGLMQFIKLIRDDKDMETLNNRHAVLAIALICLKEDDSYAFLNCIKLLIVLCDVLESAVLEMLIAEYQSAENEIDQRLKIGEVVVKVVEGLGPMSYNYKNILINCFLRESTSNVNEIRLSSLSNLSSICRILSYQIHNFFQEMLVILQSVIQNDDYLPARRSAVMVLTDIINGIDNLIDFQEILLPVYKTLRNVASSESDPSMRIHAESGLQQLNSKIKDFLIPKQSAQKEIKIFNIKDEDSATDKKCRFVDLNIK